MILVRRKIKTLKDAYEQNEIVCDKMKEMCRHAGLGSRLSVGSRLQKMTKLHKEGKLSQSQLHRFRNKVLVHQYCQGFIDGVRLDKNGGNKDE